MRTVSKPVGVWLPDARVQHHVVRLGPDDQAWPRFKCGSCGVTWVDLRRSGYPSGRDGHAGLVLWDRTTVVASDPEDALRQLQRLLRVTPDGRWGPRTATVALERPVTGLCAADLSLEAVLDVHGL